MKFLIFIPPKDFKDESVAALKLFFDRWGVDYQITSYSTKECIGYHGAIYKPDINTNKIDESQYNGIIIVDGKGIDSYKIYEFRPFLDIILRFNRDKKYIGAMGNAIKILAKANIIKDRKISTPEDQETKRAVSLFHGTPSENDIEIDGNIITIKDTRNMESSIQKVLEHIGVK
jgi:hypothetical protein